MWFILLCWALFSSLIIANVAGYEKKRGACIAWSFLGVPVIYASYLIFFHYILHKDHLVHIPEAVLLEISGFITIILAPFQPRAMYMASLISYLPVMAIILIVIELELSHDLGLFSGAMF